jgi:EAL domain-containing protein (putative c-di-GMP-specific phosphodiesterase class I)
MQKLAELPHLAKRLIFEFSEYSIDSNIDQFLPELERLRELGVRIAVDHVGQAYATINYLEQITPQYLKLHSSIIRLLDREREHHVFIQSVVQLASNVHCCVLAEGIETEAEWMQAKSLGLSGGQGFYLGRPMQKK